MRRFQYRSNNTHIISCNVGAFGWIDSLSSRKNMTHCSCRAGSGGKGKLHKGAGCSCNKTLCARDEEKWLHRSCAWREAPAAAWLPAFVVGCVVQRLTWDGRLFPCLLFLRAWMGAFVVHALLRSVLVNVTRYYSFETRVANGELSNGEPLLRCLKRARFGEKTARFSV